MCKKNRQILKLGGSEKLKKLTLSKTKFGLQKHLSRFPWTVYKIPQMERPKEYAGSNIIHIRILGKPFRQD